MTSPSSLHRQLPRPAPVNSGPGYMSRKILKFRTDKFDTCKKLKFDSCNSSKRLGTSRLHELHESKFPLFTRIEFIRSKLSNFSAPVSGKQPESDLASDRSNERSGTPTRTPPSGTRRGNPDTNSSSKPRQKEPASDSLRDATGADSLGSLGT